MTTIMTTPSLDSFANEMLRGVSYPPLTGGMIATSLFGEMVPVSKSTYSKFIATATADRIFFCASLG